MTSFVENGPGKARVRGATEHGDRPPSRGRRGATRRGRRARLATTPSWPTCSTTTGRRRPTTRSGRSPSTSGASTTPATGSSRSPATRAGPTRRALELGGGTGFFSLNLKQAGVLDRGRTSPTCRPGMVEAAQRNAARLGFEVDGRVADAERMPYDDDTFDLVVGHAVLHHIPDVELAFREMLRVLRPGGRFVFAGEPTRIGDRYARRLGRLTWKATTTVTRLPRAARAWRRPQEELDESSRAAALEAVVDLHTFDPGELAPDSRCGPARSTCGTDDRGADRRVRSAGRCARSRPRCAPARSAGAGPRSPTGSLAAAVRARPRPVPGGARSGSTTTSASPA